MLSYAQLENTLAEHFRVAPGRRKKFRMRVKQLQRLHWPRGVNNGRQSRMSYTAQHVLELAFVFELIELGLPPDRAISQVTIWWDWLRRAFLRARDSEFPVIFAFIQGDFADLVEQDPKAPAEDGAAIIGIDPSDSADDMRQALKVLARSRSSLINVSDVLSGLTGGLKNASVESAFVWAETEVWRLERDSEGAPIDPRKH